MMKHVSVVCPCGLCLPFPMSSKARLSASAMVKPNGLLSPIFFEGFPECSFERYEGAERQEPRPLRLPTEPLLSVT